MVQIPSYLTFTLVFHPGTVRAWSRNFPVEGCNFPKLPPFCPNDGMLTAATTYFFSPFSLGTFPPSRHPCHPRNPLPALATHPPLPSFSLQNMGPSGSLFIYKCLCVLKCGTKGTGLWPLGVPTLRRFIVRRWERGFWTETSGHWPTHTTALPFMCATLHVASQLLLFQREQ